ALDVSGPPAITAPIAAPTANSELALALMFTRSIWQGSRLRSCPRPGTPYTSRTQPGPATRPMIIPANLAPPPDLRATIREEPATVDAVGQYHHSPVAPVISGHAVRLADPFQDRSPGNRSATAPLGPAKTHGLKSP